MHAACRHRKVGGQSNTDPVKVDLHRRAGLDNFLNRFHTGPHAGEPAHRKRVHAQIQNFLYVGRKEYRRAAGLENMVALVGGGGAFGNMVVACHRNHAAPGCGSCHIGMLKNIGAAVYPWALAVPDAKHAVVLVGARRRKPELLRSPQCGGGQFFVDAGLKHHMVGL